MLKIENVPYHKWRSYRKGETPRLIQTKASISVMRVMGEILQAGGAVDFDHKIIDPEAKPDRVYDTISLREI